MTDLRTATAAEARWCAANQPLFDYLEMRPFPLYRPTTQRRIKNDCSATAVLCLYLAGAPEPFPGAYSGIGNTLSFLGLAHVTDPLPGDFVVYGEGLPLSDQHMAVIVEGGSDPLTMSHGQQSEPALLHVSEGCPAAAQGRVTYVRCLPVAPPTPAIVPEEDNMLVLCTDPHNGGTACLNLAEGTWFGIANPDVLGLFQKAGVKNIGKVDAATFDRFKQVASKV